MVFVRMEIWAYVLSLCEPQFYTWNILRVLARIMNACIFCFKPQDIAKVIIVEMNIIYNY